MNRVTRSEKLLNRLVDAGKLTAKGRDWLIAAIDPMHDTQLQNLAGWPDIEDQASVVRCYKQSVSLNGTGVGSDVPFDVVIQTFPILNSAQLGNPVFRANNIISPTNSLAVLEVGGVVATCYPTGSQWDVSTSAGDGVDTVIDLPETIVAGNGRLIGMGFEVVNTTAEIYRQGTAYVWRTPQQSDALGKWGKTRVLTNGTDYVTDSFMGRQVQWYPSNEQSILLLPGSRVWEASKGCYCVVPFLSADNPVTPCDYITPVVLDQFDSNIRAPFNNPPIYCQSPYLQINAGVSYYGVGVQNKFAPVHSAGAAFTGLSSQTTLTLSVNYYYEYFPSSADVGLVTLAKPSACYDPLALELYSIALSEMPVGVEASMNGLGDWFAGLVSRFAPTIGSLLTPVFGPGAAAVGVAAKGIADSYLTSQSPQSSVVVAARGRPPPLPPRTGANYPVVLVNGGGKRKRKRKKKSNPSNRQMVVYQPRQDGRRG